MLKEFPTPDATVVENLIAQWQEKHAAEAPVNEEEMTMSENMEPEGSIAPDEAAGEEAQA